MYTDTDWGSDKKDTRRFTTAVLIMIMMAGVVQSSASRSCSRSRLCHLWRLSIFAIQDIVRICQLLKEVDLECTRPTKVFIGMNACQEKLNTTIFLYWVSELPRKSTSRLLFYDDYLIKSNMALVKHKSKALEIKTKVQDYITSVIRSLSSVIRSLLIWGRNDFVIHLRMSWIKAPRLLCAMPLSWNA